MSLPTDLRSEIEARYDAWFVALEAVDTRALLQIFDETWIYSDFMGVRRNRAEYIDLVRQLGGPHLVFRLRALDCRSLDSRFVLTTGQYDCDGTAAGEPLHLRQRFTGLWDWGERQPTYLAHQTTDIVENPSW